MHALVTHASARCNAARVIQDKYNEWSMQEIPLATCLHMVRYTPASHHQAS
jgi:hypothetical protein